MGSILVSPAISQQPTRNSGHYILRPRFSDPDRVGWMGRMDGRWMDGSVGWLKALHIHVAAPHAPKIPTPHSHTACSLTFAHHTSHAFSPYPTTPNFYGSVQLTISPPADANDKQKLAQAARGWVAHMSQLWLEPARARPSVFSSTSIAARGITMGSRSACRRTARLYINFKKNRQADDLS